MWWKFKESWSIVVVIFSKIVEYSPKLSFVATILSWKCSKFLKIVDYLWIYCKILLISLQHDLLFMKLLEKRVKLLNFSDTQLCYNHSDSTVIPEILIFLGFLENFPFELIMLAVHGLHVVMKLNACYCRGHDSI